MFLHQFAKVCYVPHSASESTQLKVIHHMEPSRVMWEGSAKDLEHSSLMDAGWIVVEIRCNPDGPKDVPDYNRGKIITVV